LAAAIREYELVLMLDPGREDVARDALAQEARAQIESGGTLKQENNWGLRKMAYEIAQRTEADYRWFRFEAPSELLDGLNHNLRIADGVLRFRIFKVDPDAPVMVPPAVASPAHAGSRESRERAPQAATSETPAAEAPVAEPAPEPAAEPTAEPEAPATPPAEATEAADGNGEPATPPAEGEAAAETAPEIADSGE
jgi:small subunit ribosomal protein S6